MTGVDVEHTKAQAEKATPGPWEVIAVNDQLAVANTEIKFLVAVLHPDDTGTVGPANAALIASAPVLVAAFERVRALHEPLKLFLLDDNGSIDYSKPYGTLCRECTDIDIVHAWECDDGDPDDEYIDWPCNTIRALETP